MIRIVTQSTEVPVLSTQRLLLRRHVAADLADATAMWSSDEVVRYIGGKPFTRAEVWQRLLRYIGHWSVRPFGYWAIVERTTDRFLGEVGLANWQREGYGPHLDNPECGWVLAPHAQRQGFASEALQTVLDWADSMLDCTTACVIDPDNSASIRLAKSVGYVQITTNFELPPNSLLMERPPRVRVSSVDGH